MTVLNDTLSKQAIKRMINILFFGGFLILIVLGKKDLAIKIVQSYFKTLFTKAFDFKTRTSNAWLYIFTVINIFVIIKTSSVIITISDISSATPVEIVKLIILIFAVVSSFSVLARRLHDINRTAWLLVPGVVFPPFLIILGFMFLLPGSEGTNKYGADPRSKAYWYLN